LRVINARHILEQGSSFFFGQKTCNALLRSENVSLPVLAEVERDSPCLFSRLAGPVIYFPLYAIFLGIELEPFSPLLEGCGLRSQGDFFALGKLFVSTFQVIDQYVLQ